MSFWADTNFPPPPFLHNYGYGMPVMPVMPDSCGLNPASFQRSASFKEMAKSGDPITRAIAKNIICSGRVVKRKKLKQVNSRNECNLLSVDA